MTPEVRKTLLDAAALVRKGWTQRASARNVNGIEVLPSDPDAVCWCAWGAIWLSAPSSDVERDVVAECEIFLELPYMLSVWNDAPERTQDEVIEFLEGIATEVEQAHKGGNHD